MILAAIEGSESLDGCLAGTQSPTPPKRVRKPPATADSKPAIDPPGVYLGAITVAGFRGIGPATTLPLHPGPGLTLVVGRNGSGKSSFAEGAEVLLTGTSLRWEGRTKAWKLGWRNLHQALRDQAALPPAGGEYRGHPRCWSASTISMSWVSWRRGASGDPWQTAGATSSRDARVVQLLIRPRCRPCRLRPAS